MAHEIPATERKPPSVCFVPAVGFEPRTAMTDLVDLVCPDGTVQVSRFLLWRASQLVRDMFSTEADVDRIPLQYPSEYVRCLITACDELWMTGTILLSTADSVKALVIASYLQVKKLCLNHPQ